MQDFAALVTETLFDPVALIAVGAGSAALLSGLVARVVEAWERVT